MKIKLISAFAKGGKTLCLGLGDDQKMYLWNVISGEWLSYMAPTPKLPEAPPLQDPTVQSKNDMAAAAAKSESHRAKTVRSMLKSS
jgi:hypothetical protein